MKIIAAIGLTIGILFIVSCIALIIAGALANRSQKKWDDK